MSDGGPARSADLPVVPSAPRRPLPRWLRSLATLIGVDTAPEHVRYGSPMLRRFGWLYRWLFIGRALQRVRFEDHSAERVRRAEQAGPIVYVLLRRSSLDHLALNTVLNRRRLPLSVWAPGTPSFFWQPVIEAWFGVLVRTWRWATEGRAADPVTSGWLAEAVCKEHPVTIFLQQQQLMLQVGGDDPLRAVLDAQARTERPVQLLPVIVVWDRAPERDMPVRNFLLGSRENPNLLLTLVNLYSPFGRAPFVQVGEPLDLAELCRRVPEPRRLETTRVLLRRYLRREGRMVRGPTLLPRRVLRELVLDNPPMQAFAAEEAAATGKSVEQVQTLMRKEFDAIAANFSWLMIWSLSYLCRPLWNRVYSGYDIREEDIERIRAAVRDGTAVLAPCHKSHFDYLLLSWVLYHHDLVPPHVIAGNNLAIWPLSTLLRAAGGFFISRTFTGQRVHPVVFERYLRELLRHEYTVEFFVEGSRTRSGLLLRPRLGVLEMMFDAAAKSDQRREITLLPMALVYEQVAEEHAYRSELEGADKDRETMGQVVRAGGVLRYRFGRVYLRVGEPIKASEVVGDPAAWLSQSAETRRDKLRHAGEDLIRRIGEVVVVLPTMLVALALLAHHRRAIEHDELLGRIGRFRAFFKHKGALEADSLRHPDSAITSALDRFRDQGQLRDHTRDGQRIWEVPPGQRISLDFHKNQVLHFFAPAALAAVVVRHADREEVMLEDLLAPFALLEATVNREFTFDPDASSEERCRRALDDLVAHGALAPTETGWTLADPARLGEVHGLLRGLLEAYLLVLRAARKLPARPLDRKAFVREIQQGQETWLSSGVATRPEAFSAISLRNAIASFLEDDVLREVNGKLVLGEEPAEPRDALLSRGLGV
jgi:glycerol-3-phosphate O-acyltransferase